MSDAVCACGTCPDCAGSAPPPGPLDARRWAHGAVRERLLGRISRVTIGGRRPLAGLTTRAADDPAIALLDAFAGSLHVLAWNAAKLADDGTLARSQDRASVTALVALTGYRPRPALSATTWLAFSLDGFPGAPAEVVIPAGNRVASVPAPGELPLNFETEAELVARPEWSRLEPVLAQAVPAVNLATAMIEVAGNTLIQPGDYLLFADGAGWVLARADAVDRRPEADPPHSRISLIEHRPLVGGAAAAGHDRRKVIVLGRQATPFGAAAPDPLLLLKPGPAGVVDPVVAAINAAAIPPEWRNLTLDADPAAGNVIDIDGGRLELMLGRLAVLVGPNEALPLRVVSTTERGRSGFGLSGRVTRTTFQGLDFKQQPPTYPPAAVRSTSILLETAREALLARPQDERLPNAATPDRLAVVGRHALPSGRRLLLTGRTATGPAQEALALLRAEQRADGTTLLIFTAPVETPFLAVGLSVLGNVVAASHGESSAAGAELLGMGDANRSGQRVVLSRGPVSMVPAATNAGFAPALEVRVGGRRYEIAEHLHGLPETATAAMLTPREDGKAELLFAGRLPSGAAITARYRHGAGAAGNVAAGRLTTLLAPVPGVRSVTNPMAADGGSDAESLAVMRSAAPRRLRSFERVVTLSDYQAFAEGWRGIGKALASEVMLGMRRIVVVTIASSRLAPPGADACRALAAALRAAGLPGAAVTVQGFQPLVATVNLALAIDPALLRTDVEEAVRGRLAAAFGPAARGFAEGLAASAVLATVQGTPGVRHCALTRFSLGSVGPDQGRLLSPGPQSVKGANGQWTVSLAGLLAIDADAIGFQERSP